MRLRSLLFCALGAVLALPSTAAEAATVPPPVIGEEMNGRHMELAEGSYLDVRLGSNRSTGYSWKIIELDEKVLMRLGEPLYEQTPPPMPGKPGVEIFRFKAFGEGETCLKMAYVPPGDRPEPPARTFSLCFKVIGGLHPIAPNP